MRPTYPRRPKLSQPDYDFERVLSTIGVRMSPREERAIRNEELFREVNLNIAELEEQAGRTDWDELLPLVCECSRTGCSFPIEVDAATFERVRESPLRFLVASGHEQLDIETVLERREGYSIVEKSPPDLHPS
jgi:hypothetical protein